MYEDNSTAEITGSDTITTNFDNRPGLVNIRIVATGGNGFQVGSSYAIVVIAGTVGGSNIEGEVVAQFTINRGSALRPSTVGRSLDIAASGEVALDLGSTIGTLDAAQFGADFLTSAKIANNAFLGVNFAAGSLDGKGDWNIGKSGYALTVADWNVGKSGYSLSVADWNVGKTGYDLNADQSGVTFGTLNALAANVITAAAIQADAINASKVAADVHAEAADAVWDENIVSAHGAASAAGLLLRALGEVISARSNNPTLDALLGVADSAANDVPNQILTGETMAELVQGLPDVTPTVAKALMMHYMIGRNELHVSTGNKEMYNDAGTQIAKKVLTDVANVYDEAKMISGV